ncbi:MAG: NADH-quinone oxidoreductase subunit N [Oligoflexia bacterium]|nr:NADH-quinone oxidoreductase subunit N [Oligoflexia bacterium]
MLNVQMHEVMLIQKIPSAIWPFLFPVIILSIFAILNLVIAPLLSSKHTKKGRTGVVFFMAVIALLLCTFSALFNFTLTSETLFAGLLVFDNLAKYSTIVLCLGGLFSIINLYESEIACDQREETPLPAEVYILLLFSLIGMIILASTTHLFMMFVALEIMSYSIYVMVAIRRTSKNSSEAGLKYFIMGGVSSAFFLYGLVLVFGNLGTLELTKASLALTLLNPHQILLLIVGSIMIIGALLFKVGAFPFHSWVADVYQGANTAITGFMASAVKFASFIMILRLTKYLFFASTTASTNASTNVSANSEAIFLVLSISALLTMIWGNVLAIQQSNIKRLLAYSTIAHTGYLLLAVLASQNSVRSFEALIFYLTAYFFSTLGTFAVLSLFRDKDDKNDKELESELTIDSLRGMGFKHHLLGVAFTLFLLSFAGIPLTAGFIGKFFLFSSILPKIHFTFVIVAVLTSLISLSYYLKLIAVMYMRGEERMYGVVDRLEYNPVNATTIIISFTAIFTLFLGIFPGPMLTIIASLF